MKNAKNHKFFDGAIWKKTQIDAQHRITIPKKLRKYANLNKNSKILWETVSRYKKKDNEFLVLIGVQER